jgi:hypothetical protein
MNSDWERGYDAGYRAALGTARRDIGRDLGDTAPAPKKAKKPRKVSAYHRRYGKEFKRVEGKYKNKRGGWKKDGFRLAQAAAHKATRKAMK